MTTPITAVVLTYNEEPNLRRTLERLTWASEVVVIDSGSTDATCEIAGKFPNVRVVQNAFRSHAEQWTFGLEHGDIPTEWVLALDADYVLTDELVEELTHFAPPPDVAGYQASFNYCVNGRRLHGTLYPPVTVLFRRQLTHVEQDGHAQRARVTGEVRKLQGRIDHDDRKSLGRWLASQARYMQLEADKLQHAPAGSLSTIDRLRKWVVIAPPLVFGYSLVVQRGLLDGWPGMLYAIQRTTAELILSMYLVERRLTRRGLSADRQ